MGDRAQVAGKPVADIGQQVTVVLQRAKYVVSDGNEVPNDDYFMTEMYNQAIVQDEGVQRLVRVILWGTHIKIADIVKGTPTFYIHKINKFYPPGAPSVWAFHTWLWRTCNVFVDMRRICLGEGADPTLSLNKIYDRNEQEYRMSRRTQGKQRKKQKPATQSVAPGLPDRINRAMLHEGQGSRRIDMTKLFLPEEEVAVHESGGDDIDKLMKEREAARERARERTRRAAERHQNQAARAPQVPSKEAQHEDDMDAILKAREERKEARRKTRPKPPQSMREQGTHVEHPPPSSLQRRRMHST